MASDEFAVFLRGERDVMLPLLKNEDTDSGRKAKRKFQF